MGQSIFEYAHPCDHEEIQEVLSPRSDEVGEAARTIFVRIKCTLTSKGRNVNLKSASYKVGSWLMKKCVEIFLFVWALNPVVFGIGDFHGLVHLNILMEITGNLCKMKFEFNFMLSNKIHLNCCPMIITVIPVHVYLRQDYPIILWFL